MGATRATRIRTFHLSVLVISAVGFAIGFWMTIKSHQYYHPDVPGMVSRMQETTLTAERRGRYEISYKDDFGTLAIEVVSEETGNPVPLAPFGMLARIFHTAGWRGYAFHVDRPGDYRLSVQPWKEGSEIFVTYSDTQAIAVWALGGIILVGLCAGLAGRSLIEIVRRERVSRGGEG